MTEWWNSFTTTAQKFADQVTDTIVTQAAIVENEIAQERERVRQQATPQTNSNSTLLPWESTDESKSILCEDLMQQILKLSHCDQNFTVTPNEELIQLLQFNFRDKISQVMSLLSLDHNLARLHAKISPKMEEEIFWRNYYARIYYLRYLSGIDSPKSNSILDSLIFDEVVFISNVNDSSPSKISAVTQPASSSTSSTTTTSTTSSKGKSDSPIKTHSSSSPHSEKISSPISLPPPSPPPNSRSSPNITTQISGASTENSSDWDTCDDVKETSSGTKTSSSSSNKTSSTSSSSSKSKKMSAEIENMKKLENERMKKREAEAAALAAEVAAALEEDLKQKKSSTSVGKSTTSTKITTAPITTTKITAPPPKTTTTFDDNLDMTDLDLLDIGDSEEFEDLGVGGDDDELEAQIARELEDL